MKRNFVLLMVALMSAVMVNAKTVQKERSRDR